jgi:SAM-dependent methyltransferase
MTKAPTNSSLKDQAQRFYAARDLARFGRENLSQWEPLIRKELATVKIDAPMILELGVGRTKWKELPGHYVAVDIGAAVLKDKQTAKVQADMQRLPFADGSLAFLFSIAALEHVPLPELVLAEIVRALAPGGKALLAPAWFCRPWAAKGLPVKSYAELPWMDKLRKASLIVRENILFRALGILPRRLWRELRWMLARRPLPFDYIRLEPNLDEYVMSDSDAFTSMDPHAALLFFLSRGLEASQKGIWKRVLGRYHYLNITKPTARAQT